MKKNKATHIMSIVLMVLFVAIFLTLSGRFLYIQATGEIAGVSLQEWADNKRTNNFTLEATRGTIFDRNQMTLAQDRPTYKLYAVVDQEYVGVGEEPLHVVDPQHTAQSLAPYLNMETSEIQNKINWGISEGKFQVEFGTSSKELSQEQKDEIESLELPGVQFEKEPIRYYPNGMFASHIIGLAQKQDIEEDGRKVDEVIEGITGIEKKMNTVLSGVDGHVSYKRDKFNTKLLNPDEIIKQAHDGNDVYLTIDQKIQTLLEDAMSQVDQQYEPERMTAVVMDPKTGEVLALSNRPSYNPNQLGEVENWYNDVIATPFEPGSTMKIFTLAAAIEEGVYQPNDYFESGSYQIDENDSINDWNYGGWGSISFREGIQRSSNVGAAILAYDKVGPDKFYQYLQEFHFDQPSGIDLPGETIGKILYNYKSEKITTSYGQGTTVTPIQQMKAVTAIANDGNMVQPYVISKIVDSATGDIIQENEPVKVGNPISSQTAKMVRDELETVITSENGTGRVYKLDDYTLAGKTGTAQIPDPDNPQPYMTGDGNYVYSFLGMAPKDDPELIMYVSVKQPNLETHESGSEPASFIFKNVMSNSLHYLNIQPDKQTQAPIDSYEMPEVVGKSVSDVEQQLELEELRVTVLGDGHEVNKVNVESGERLLPNQRIILVTDNPSMPDLSGWSVRDVLEISEILELDVSVNGSGYAINQNIEVGALISEQTDLKVEFTPPQFESVDENEKEADVKLNEETEG